MQQQKVPKLELDNFSKKMNEKNVYEDVGTTPMATTQRRESTISTDKKQMT